MADAQYPGGVSRRRALLTGAGLVAAGAVAGATGGYFATQVASGAGADGEAKVPVMVHLRDAQAGKFDVFFGDVKVEMVDANFAAKLVKASAAMV